jgi:type II secretory pathway component HofQ
MRPLYLTIAAALTLAPSLVLAQGGLEAREKSRGNVAALEKDQNFVELEITIAEWVAPTDAKETSDRSKLEGPSDEVAKQIRALQQSGQLSSIQRVRLVSADGFTATAQIGSDHPRVVGTQFSPRGGAVNSIEYRSTGSVISLTPRLIDEGRIAVELEVNKSGLASDADSPVLAENGSGKPTRADSTRTFTLRTIGVARLGETVAVSGWESSKDGCLVLMSAKKVLSEPKK